MKLYDKKIWVLLKCAHQNTESFMLDKIQHNKMYVIRTTAWIKEMVKIISNLKEIIKEEKKTRQNYECNKYQNLPKKFHSSDILLTRKVYQLYNFQYLMRKNNTKKMHTNKIDLFLYTFYFAIFFLGFAHFVNFC